jgi:putative glutamine amidotransferase
MTRQNHPLVAVTAGTREWDGLERVRLNEAYVQAIAAAGLVPVVVPPLDPALAPAVLDGVAGLVLSGGEDVDPARYGAAPHSALGAVHAARDAWELALVGEARRRGTPTLAICRGIQVLNVALGGTLVQDIPSERPTDLPHDAAARRTERVHAVKLDGDSRLAAALGVAGETRIVANSSHHQSVDRVADGLRVVATAPDGIIEGVESTDDWWMLAVQWHPEELTRTPEEWDRSLFEAFARAVRSS